MSENETPEETTDEPTVSADVNDAEPEGTEPLGDAGKKALDSMKSKWHTERDKRRELEARIAELEKPDESEKPDVDVDAIRRDVASKANSRILRSEVKAAATGKLADPTDAYRYLDMDNFEVDANGDVDAEEISEAIADLLTNKPYLAAATASRFQGTVDGGARKASGPSQLTESDLDKMSANEIVQARKDGRLDTLLKGNKP